MKIDTAWKWIMLGSKLLQISCVTNFMRGKIKETFTNFIAVVESSILCA